MDCYKFIDDAINGESAVGSISSIISMVMDTIDSSDYKDNDNVQKYYSDLVMIQDLLYHYSND